MCIYVLLKRIRRESIRTYTKTATTFNNISIRKSRMGKPRRDNRSYSNHNSSIRVLQSRGGKNYTYCIVALCGSYIDEDRVKYGHRCHTHPWCKRQPNIVYCELQCGVRQYNTVYSHYIMYNIEFSESKPLATVIYSGDGDKRLEKRHDRDMLRGRNKKKKKR